MKQLLSLIDIHSLLDNYYSLARLIITVDVNGKFKDPEDDYIY